ncbi:MAG: ATP-binding protein [Actinomycetota bacterium]
MGIVVVADGDDDDAALAAFLAGNPWLERRDGEPWEARLLVGTRLGEVGLDRIRQAPWCGAVEIGSGMVTPGQWFRRHLEAGGIGLGLRTDTAYSCGPTEHLLHALADRFGLAGAALDAATLALHEAVANALVHGNLDIASFEEGNTEAFLAYCGTVDERLADERFAGRMVFLSALPVDGAIEVAIEDQGRGYDDPADRRRQADEIRRHGLGLIRALAGARVEDGGRRLILTLGL